MNRPTAAEVIEGEGSALQMARQSLANALASTSPQERERLYLATIAAALVAIAEERR